MNYTPKNRELQSYFANAIYVKIDCRANFVIPATCPAEASWRRGKAGIPV